MAYCVKCGEKVEDTVVTCPVCGAMIPKAKTADQGGESGRYTYGNMNHTYYHLQMREGFFPESEIRSYKVMAVLCYLGVLVFIPIFAGDRQSEYLKLHKNQGLILFIIDTLVDLIENNWGWSAGFFSQITGGALDIVYDIVKVVVLILWLMGLTYACRGTKNELPGIGKIKIFK